MRAAGWALIALCGGGCGLVLDLDPQDDAGSAPSFDSGRDAASSACRAAADCDDEDACNGVEACVAGRCAAGVPVECTDSVTCTEDTCERASGECVRTPRDELCPDDTSACTVERCDARAGCTPILRHELCDDGIFCTVDVCDPDDPSPTRCRHDPSDVLCSAATCIR